MRCRHPLPYRRYFPQSFWLLHRGAPQSVVDEIVTVLDEEMQTVHPLGTTAPETPLPALRALVASALARGERPLIVLLTGHFDGPTCHKTLAPLRRPYRWNSYYRFRIEECPLDPRHDLDVDLASLDDPQARRQALHKIVPTSASLMC